MFLRSQRVKRYDAIIVGVGAAGSAAARALASRGASVLAIERSTIPNATSSHHGLTRVFRMCYHEHPSYVPLLRRALSLWQELQDEIGEELLTLPGAFCAGPDGGEVIRGMIAAAAEHGLRLEQLTRRALDAQFPQFRVPDGHAAVFEPIAGYVRCERAIGAMARLAIRAGAELRGEEPVLRWRAGPEGVEVETGEGVYAGRTLVLCAGAWTPGLAKTRLPLVVTSQAVAWVRPARPERFAGPGAPVWAMEHAGVLYYGLPLGAGGPKEEGMKIARHKPGPRVTDPGAPRAFSRGDALLLDAFLTTRMPDGAGELAAGATCLYTNSPDGHFLIDRHPEHANVIVASPCSGHGFKFAPAIGEVLADLTLHGTTRHDIALFADTPRRFHR